MGIPRVVPSPSVNRRCLSDSESHRGVGGRLKKSKKNTAPAGWPRRLALVQATSRAEVDVIGAQLCSCARAIFS